MHVLRLWCVLLALVISKNGAIELSCDSAKPSVQSHVKCVCRRTSGTGIDWYLNDNFHSNCYLSSGCLPQYPGYLYGINSTKKVFEITINSYNYSDCTKVSCIDASDSSIGRSMVPTSITFDTTYPMSLTEPAANDKNGEISLTTGCISGFSEVKNKWYAILDGLEEVYMPDPATIKDTADNSSCFNCNSDNNGKRTIGFDHREEPGIGTKNVLFRVILYHDSTNLILNLTTLNVYTIKEKKTTTSKPVKDVQNINPVAVVIPVLIVVAGIVIVVVFVCQRRESKPKNRDTVGNGYENLHDTNDNAIESKDYESNIDTENNGDNNLDIKDSEDKAGQVGERTKPAKHDKDLKTDEGPEKESGREQDKPEERELTNIHADDSGNKDESSIDTKNNGDNNLDIKDSEDKAGQVGEGTKQATHDKDLKTDEGPEQESGREQDKPEERELTEIHEDDSENKDESSNTAEQVPNPPSTNKE